MHEEWLFTWVH